MTHVLSPYLSCRPHVSLVALMSCRPISLLLSPSHLSRRPIRQDFALKSFKDKLNKAESGRVGDEELEASLAKLTDKVLPCPCAVPLATKGPFVDTTCACDTL